jgi:outer membrane protein OmpA-like peptidoglycan-associated protein
VRPLLILLFIFPKILLAQTEEIRFSFTAHETKLNAPQKEKLKDITSANKLIKLSVFAYMSRGPSPSKNRMLMEHRLQEIRNLLAAKGIHRSAIKTSMRFTSVAKAANTIQLVPMYSKKLAPNVLYETPIVQIRNLTYPSLIKVAKPKKEVIKKETPVAPPKTIGPFRLADFRKNEKIIIPNLLFEATRHDLLKSSHRSLNHLVAVLKAKPSLIIQLQGHICCKSNGEDGMDFGTGSDNLSENRAAAVAVYLVLNGIDRKRLTYKGFGSKNKLVEDYGNARKGKVNRRVEVFVVSE